MHRQIDLDQRPRGPIGNKDDPYFDPNEDPSYNYKFETRTYSKNENADSRGDVKGIVLCTYFIYCCTLTLKPSVHRSATYASDA